MAAESDKKTVADRVTARKADWPEVLKTRHLRIMFPSEHSMRATQKKSWHRILTGAYVPGRVQNWLPEVKEAPAWEEQNAKEGKLASLLRRADGHGDGSVSLD
jgi:hypothetical protein